jgi:adenine-specific DNA-methyltransferase
VAQTDITEPELVWAGKYDEQGERAAPPRVTLPFQIIETINDSRATREARKKPAQTSLFDVWGADEGETFEAGWRNKLVWGDNLLVMSSLLQQFAGKIDLIYIDPPFATGADFSIRALVGESDDELEKAQSIIEEKAYRDSWGDGLNSYLSMIAPRLGLIRALLSPSGSLYVHCDWRVNSHIRLILDSEFGIEAFRNEIQWCYSGGGVPRGDYPRKHDTILRYVKGPGSVFNVEYKPYKENTQQVGKHSTYVAAERRDIDLSRGTPVTDWWTDIPTVTGWNPEKVGFPTQKPEALLSRIVTTSSRPGDLVADFFVGSGTTAVVAEKLGRRWIGVDLGRFAVHTTRKRIMAIQDAKPFEVLNLGRYERQYWQASAFGERDLQQVLFEYLAFILKLYGAGAVAGMQHIHGSKAGAAVHVGAVDCPVTIDEVAKALDECVATGQQELHVLGWEWEMGLNDTVDQLAVERKVRMKLLAIPREVMEPQAIASGSIRFFELAHLDCSVEEKQGREVAVTLSGFAMSGADGIDPEALAKIRRWSDFVDYWAVDWDFQNDTFINGWVAYRTQKDRRLVMTSDSHTYQISGTYRIAVKVVDIFGNDTTKIFPVEVR